MFHFLLLTSVLSAGHSWVLNSTHNNIIPQLTDDVTLQCSYESSGDVIKTMGKIARIRFLKLNNKKEWKKYAEIIFPNTSQAQVIGSNDPFLSASGYLGRVSESYLSVTWSTSSEETVGSYKCEIDGFAMDDGNDVHVITGTVNITHKDVTTKELLDLVVQMRKKSDELTKDIFNIYDDIFVQHQTLIRNMKRQVDSAIVNSYFELRNWPAGQFGLLATDDGCPDTFSSKFESGFVQFETETSRRPRHNFTSASNLKGEVFVRCGSRNVLNFSICAAHIQEPRALWPAGSYCIPYTVGCPVGFKFGQTRFFPETLKSIIGKDFFDCTDHSNEYIDFHYCCRSDGPPQTPILLPNAKPFYLYRNKGRCQEVHGAQVEEQMFTIQTDATKTDKFLNEVHPDGTVNDVIFHLCYYYQK